MRIISSAVNANNSWVTICFTQVGVLTKARDFADAAGCGFSHNVTLDPNHDTPVSFGTISFNRGDHSKVLGQFVSWVNSNCSRF